MKRILVSPLDWGLGHATRCIPVIRYLLKKNCEVIIGADKRPMELLKKEFPSCEFIVMPGYEIIYPASGSMVLKMAAQIPKILGGINREHEQLQEIISDKRIDAVISDNRFGLWSREVPCVFITHQLMVKSPLGENFIRKKNLEYISKFSQCWVVDIETENNLSGDLSHKFALPGNAGFVGLLSRFVPPAASLQNENGKKYHLLVILSGPEPQRTMFERKILDQFKNIRLNHPWQGELSAIIIQGITEKNERRNIYKNVEMVSHLTSDELQRTILSSEIILSRPGYSTVMDLAVLGKKAIFVPTPGQTEQEYLAKRFMEKNIAYSVSQKKFDLNIALKESKKYSGFTENYSGEDFKKEVDLFCETARPAEPLGWASSRSKHRDSQ